MSILAFWGASLPYEVVCIPARLHRAKGYSLTAKWCLQTAWEILFGTPFRKIAEIIVTESHRANEFKGV